MGVLEPQEVMPSGLKNNIDWPSYRLTEMGKWLVEGFDVLPMSAPVAAPLPAVKSKRVIEGQAKPWRIPAWAAKRIEQQYPEQGDELKQLITRLFKEGILEETTATPQAIRAAVHNPKTGRQLGFTRLARLHLKPPEQKALAYWLNIGPLLYGREVSEHEARQLLRLPLTDELGVYIQESVYRPLVRLLAESNDDT